MSGSHFFGLRDINNNEIFANKSIVQFSNSGKSFKGIFKYDKNIAAYIIDCVDTDKIFIYACSLNHIKDLKIVDTL